MRPDEFARLRRLSSDRITTALEREFRGLGSWRDRDVPGFVARAAPLVRGGQRAVSALTAFYIADRAGDALGRRLGPPGLPPAETTGLRGVPADQVYRRPFVQIYAALARGGPFTRALDLGAGRLVRIAELDLQQAYARSAQAAMARLPRSAAPSGWRRVLTGSDSCPLCVVASTQRYHVEELLPIHSLCGCTVEPLFGTQGQVIDPDRLEEVHRAVEALGGTADRSARLPEYRQLRLDLVSHHGEIGPVLADPRYRYRFTGPRDI